MLPLPLSRLCPHSAILTYPCPSAARTGALMTVVKAGKKEGLFESLEQVAGPGRPLDDSVFAAALESASDATRLEALEVLVAHPKTSALPTPLEMQLFLAAVRTGMRCQQSGIRAKWCVLLRRLLTRTCQGVKSVFTRMRRERRDAQGIKQHLPAVGSQPPKRAQMGLAPPPEEDTSAEGLRAIEAFLQEVAGEALASLYPGATHERMIVAFEILTCMLELWPLGGTEEAAGVAAEGDEEDGAAGRRGGGGGAVKSVGGAKKAKVDEEGSAASAALPPYQPPPFDPLGRARFLRADVSTWMINSVINPWTVVRQLAMRLLLLLPSPLPGYATPESLQPLLDQALALSASPRVRESDAGSRLIKLLFAKYVRGLGWELALRPHIHLRLPAASSGNANINGNGNSSAAPSSATAVAAAPTGASLMAQVRFYGSLCDEVEAAISAGRANLLSACRRGLAHNPLLLTRYVSEEVEWGRIAGCDVAGGEMRATLARLRALLQEATDVSMWALSAPKELNVSAVYCYCLPSLLFCLLPLSLCSPL
jgi:hypothetical protein